MWFRKNGLLPREISVKTMTELTACMDMLVKRDAVPLLEAKSGLARTVQ